RVDAAARRRPRRGRCGGRAKVWAPPQQAGSSKSIRPLPSSSRQLPQISAGVVSAAGGQPERSTLRQSAAQARVPPAHVRPPRSSPSQTSPHSSSITPLPHSSSPLASQPSQSTVLPSSHSSSQSTTPLPTASMLQCDEQPSQLSALPSSHCSPGSSRPSPQRGGEGGPFGVHGPVVNAPQPLQVRNEPPGDVQATSPSHTSPASTMPSPHTGPGGSVVVVVD